MASRVLGIELLRVISMFLVVAGHYCYHGVKAEPALSEFPIDTFPHIVNYCIMEYIWVIACIAVDCYILITGYFLADRITYRWKAIVKLWFQTVFYCMAFAVLFGLYNGHFSFKDVLHAITPFHSQSYWFITNYFGLMLIAPFLSMLLRQLTKKQYLILLCVGFVISFQPLYGHLLAGTMSMWWFVYLYIFAAYVKLYGLPRIFMDNSGKFFWIVAAVLFLAATIYNILNHYVSGASFHLVSSANDGPIFFLAICAFCFFLKMDYSGNKLLCSISKLAPYTLGVYLISENPLLKEWGLWDNVLKTMGEIPMPVHCILSTLTIFILCTVADYARAVIFRVLRIDNLSLFITDKLPKSL